MSKVFIIGIILTYLGLLFVIAYWAEKNKQSKLVNSPYLYALSLAVYCSAWTYYGSVGIAARSGIEFLAIYIGPVIAAPLWIVILRKTIMLSKNYKVSSIADFISIRYGKNRSVGAIVTIVCALSIIPYISLQLKAISETFQIVAKANAPYFRSFIFQDSTFYIALILAVFASFFGTLSLDASQKRKGIMFTVAIESVLKLFFFLIIGVYVVYVVFDGTSDIYEKASSQLDLKPLTNIGGLTGGINWYFTIFLSFLAIFLLPRQFQTSVVEFSNRQQLKKAVWVFPLYLLLFNLFVIFIAWGGLILLGDQVNPDYFSLLIPLYMGQDWLALLVFLGGFSAVISMIVISTIALSSMLSNNLIIPYGFLKKFQKSEVLKNQRIIKNIRRISIFSSILIAYLLYVLFDPKIGLYSIGLVSFLIIAQLAPSFFLGLYWNRGSSQGLKIGMVAGVIIAIYTFLVPFISNSIFGHNDLKMYGPYGLSFLKPHSLFGLDILNPVSHSLFWSLLINTFLFAGISVSVKGNYRERNYGEIFVNTEQIIPLQETAFVWKGKAYVDDIQNILIQFIGKSRAEKALRIFRQRYGVDPNDKLADARFINFSEKLLTGAVGSASAKILIGNVAKEKPVSLVEVLAILEENKEAIAVNKSLEAQSSRLIHLTDQLKNANQELKIQDQLKDNFLDTVAHELKTPITSIKASSEVLLDNEDMSIELQKQFLKNIFSDTERITQLINDILNLEKLTSGREELQLKEKNIIAIVKKTIELVKPITHKNKIQIELSTSEEEVLIQCDESKMIQVFTNILSNALKFVPKESGRIDLSIENDINEVVCKIKDNGKGIPADDIELIFKKFYQSSNQTLKKPSGSGFGLAICKQITELHGGQIYAESELEKGAAFIIKLPKQDKS
jgi:Na+/proline symporter/nitrogen-specific signal transduction histidine kinase